VNIFLLNAGLFEMILKEKKMNLPEKAKILHTYTAFQKNIETTIS
jgi:hypothetical protein